MIDQTMVGAESAPGLPQPQIDCWEAGLKPMLHIPVAQSGGTMTIDNGIPMSHIRAIINPKKTEI